MNENYTHILDLASKVDPPDDGILTRTLFNGDDVKAVIFGFGKGEECRFSYRCCGESRDGSEGSGEG